MSETLDLSLYAKPAADGTLGMDVAVEGISCGACIARIEGAVKRLPGVSEARLNFTNRRLHVAWDDGLVKPSQILSAIEAVGYHGYPFVPLRAEQEEAAEARRLLRCLAVAGFAAMNIMLLSVAVWSGNASDITPETRDFFHWASALIALPAAAYAGQPFFVSAWRALRARTLNMNVPISLGVILALGLSVVETINHAADAYYDSALMLLFFLLVGRTLEHAMRRKTRTVAGNLAALKGETARRFEGDELVSVPVAALKPGERVLLRAGERVPADGVVLSGRSEIDESIITGETARRAVKAGATVYAGAMNYAGTLTLKTTAAGGTALIDEIEQLLDKAASAKSHALRLADRAARIYAPMVHATAALTAAGWLIAGSSVHDAVVTAITVLIITCPCALALAIALSREATLRMPFNAATEEPGLGVRAKIAGVEARLGSAEFCGLADTPAPAADASSIYFVYGAQSAVIAISQKLRSDAAATVGALTQLGFEVLILSGDRNDAVRPVARGLGIARWMGELKPAEKIACIESLKADGRRVLMIGDGLNDAPALAAAHVSLSPIAAADLTQAQADAVFLGERLAPVVDAVVIARRARRLMSENLALAAIYNTIAVPVAILGVVTPLIAALAMSGSSILVTLNALRARRSGARS